MCGNHQSKTRNVMAAVYLVVVVLVELFHPNTALSKYGCDFEMNGILPEPQPLFLLPDGSNNGFGFLLPKGTDSVVSLNQGDWVLLACPGSGNYLPVLGSKVQAILAKCCSGGEFCIGSQSYPLAQLNCFSYPYHVARSSGHACFDGTMKQLEIGFEVLASNNFFKLMDVCFDDSMLTTLYSKYDLVSGINGFQRSFEKPNFLADGFFYNLTLDKLYKKSEQNETIGQILGSEELGNYYTTTTFLSKGHLTARADFVYTVQQRSTFHYINVAPQWESFNNGSWEELERSVRNFASNRSLDLIVYTGTYGVATLPDVNDVQKEIYLYLDQNNSHAIPVPAFFWKVVYEPVSQTGIAFVGINNPYLVFVTSDHLLCQDVCTHTTWRTWNRQNIRTGYGYCCDVNEFRAKVKTLPDFPVVGLLGKSGSRQNALGVQHVCFLFLLSALRCYKVLEI